MVVVVAERDAPPADEPAEEVVRVASPRTRPDGRRTGVRRLIDLAGWEPLGLSVDWAAVEEELGVPLPADHKELVAAFGGGVFSDDTVSFLGRSTNVSFDLITHVFETLCEISGARLLSGFVPDRTHERCTRLTYSRNSIAPISSLRIAFSGACSGNVMTSV